MPYTHSKKLLLAMSISLALSGCGGGGGGGGGGGPSPDPVISDPTPVPDPDPDLAPDPDISNPAPDSPPPPPPPPPPPDPFELAKQRSTEVSNVFEKIRESQPRQGSVSQSTNVDGSGRTKDAMSITITGAADTPQYTFVYDDGIAATPDETIAVDTTQLGVNLEKLTIVSGSYQYLKIGEEYGRPFDADGNDTDEGIIVMSVFSNYKGDMDYIAAGNWFYIRNDFDIKDASFGAFADGGQSFNVGGLTGGSASYTGGVIGLVSAYNPSIGTLILEDFRAKVDLTANFGLGAEISGAITEIEGAITPKINGAINLNRATIADDGFFSGSLDGKLQTIDVNGNWGGQFYGDTERDTEPEWVAGTAGGGGGGTSAKDVKVNFMATFVGEKQ